MKEKKNIDLLISEAKKKHAAQLRRLREQAAKEEQEILIRVSRLLAKHEPDLFAQYSDHALRLIEQERNQRAERARSARARRKQKVADSESGGGSQ
ncbi:hypothetical protein G7Y41_06885 [Schaalia sp. ZJ405]|uniref:hypothetical protein n=1 Tax=Schaalia sp. ZJ405 TaxID=2709403 RepID=UPI0013EDEE99|nr:hypothetical protein [Schaalia sp. ZJ405]QPK80781.1 hypothetical protein G7Y41_06885 [Schaalia sp. ZJ405]